jgi:hypothetical protein
MESALDKLMAEKTGQKDGSFDLRLDKSLRRAPAAVKKAAEGFKHARQQAGHPKLMRMLDSDQLQAQFATLTEYLSAIDVADRRKGLILSTLGSISFNLLVVFIVLMVWLVWRGYL